MNSEFDIGKELQNAFKDGYNTGFKDVIKIIEDYKHENRQHETLLNNLTARITKLYYERTIKLFCRGE